MSSNTTSRCWIIAILLPARYLLRKSIGQFSLFSPFGVVGPVRKKEWLGFRTHSSNKLYKLYLSKCFHIQTYYFFFNVNYVQVMSNTLYSHCSFHLFSKSFVFIRHALVIIDVMRPALKVENNSNQLAKQVGTISLQKIHPEKIEINSWKF